MQSNSADLAAEVMQLDGTSKGCKPLRKIELMEVIGYDRQFVFQT